MKNGCAKQRAEYESGFVNGFAGNCDRYKAEQYRQGGQHESEQPLVREYWTGCWDGIQQAATARRSALQGMERADLPIVVIHLTFGGNRQYLGRVATLLEFTEYRKNCGFPPDDVVYETW